jgi:hypothetical protein
MIGVAASESTSVVEDALSKMLLGSLPLRLTLYVYEKVQAGQRRTLVEKGRVLQGAQYDVDSTIVFPFLSSLLLRQRDPGQQTDRRENWITDRAVRWQCPLLFFPHRETHLPPST